MFVFSNFAVSTLVESIGIGDTTILINSDDVPRFPALGAGQKFPLILADSDDIAEILYVTALTGGGVATVERGAEGTQPQSWLAGTLAQHTYTAATVQFAAGLHPQGEWSALTAYDPNDIVTVDGISYIAVSASTNSLPANDNPDWQPIYNPTGTNAVTLTWQGRYDAGTTYGLGHLVEYQNRVWRAITADNTGQLPAYGSSFWEPLARAGGLTEVSQIHTFLGTNNYTLTLSDADGPTNLFHGLRLVGRFQNANTNASTLTITRGATEFGAVPLRFSAGVNLSGGDIAAGPLYEWTYDSGSTEFLATSSPSNATPAGTIVDFAGVVAPTGWLFCNGQAISRTGFARLFAVLSTIYGSGDGSTTFNLPDLRGRVIAGADDMGGVGAAGVLPGVSLSNTSGAATHTLTGAEMPVHGHAVDDAGHSHTITDPGHNHSVTDPGHGHVTNNPVHTHAISDGGHTHGLTDPGHAHSYGDIQPNYSASFDSGVTQASPNSSELSRTTISAATGISMASATTGISIQNAATNVSVNNAVTGVQVDVDPTNIGINLAATGITIENTGGGTAHPNVQPTMGLNKIIKT
jgi:microcystin-dependent protein